MTVGGIANADSDMFYIHIEVWKELHNIKLFKLTVMTSLHIQCANMHHMIGSVIPFYTLHTSMALRYI